MALLWDKSVRVGGHNYSIIFYLLFFIVGTCSSTSNVTHFTYVSVFTSNETTALSTGMAIGSMLAGFMGILQGTVLGNVGMGIDANFFLAAALYVPAMCLIWSRAAIILPMSGGDDDVLESDMSSHAALLGHDNVDSEDMINESDDNRENINEVMFKKVEKCDKEDIDEAIHNRFKSLLTLQLLNCSLGYGVIPSLISPICSRFSSSSTVLLLATGLYCILDPICRAFTAVRPIKTVNGITIFSCFLYFMAAALLVTLTLPGDTYLLTSSGGGVYPVVIYVGEWIVSVLLQG